MILALVHLLQRRLLDHVMVDTWPSIAVCVLLRRLLRYCRFHGTLPAAPTPRMIIFRADAATGATSSNVAATAAAAAAAASTAVLVSFGSKLLAETGADIFFLPRAYSFVR